MNGERPLATLSLDRCLACGSSDFGSLPLRYEYRDASFPLAVCRGCGMRFLRVQPNGDGLAELYRAPYFERDFRCGRSAGSSFHEAAFRDENRGLLDAFARLGPPGRLLEIGSAAGWLLKHARERGWQVQGVELSAEAAAHAHALGLDVFHGELGAAGLPADHFDLVYMGDVLEHVPDCRAALAEVVRVLAPGGHLFLRGPITTNSLARRLALGLYGLAGRSIVLREPPYHLWEFTPPSLVRLCRAVGFEVVELRESKISPGRTHGQKRAHERLVMGALDAVNLPLTALVNRWGDRIVLVARKLASPR
ncbi:MAG TPA: class I SAM-dependent methyltransferase [Candidatus Limnocylindria bacterium]|nr:class I SAM-dependent methyltransferase [Candidatus Limnocylindria bacterium]